VAVTCQTTLLDSDESLVDEFSKKHVGFPTSSWRQFYILLKRTFLSVLRDKVNTHFLIGGK